MENKTYTQNDEIKLMKSILRKVLSLRKKEFLIIGVENACKSDETNYFGQEMCEWENFYSPQLLLELDEVYLMNSLEECEEDLEDNFEKERL